jgi:hypothetical protein
VVFLENKLCCLGKGFSSYWAVAAQLRTIGISNCCCVGIHIIKRTQARHFFAETKSLWSQEIIENHIQFG